MSKIKKRKKQAKRESSTKYNFNDLPALFSPKLVVLDEVFRRDLPAFDELMVNEDLKINLYVMMKKQFCTETLLFYLEMNMFEEKFDRFVTKERVRLAMDSDTNENVQITEIKSLKRADTPTSSNSFNNQQRDDGFHLISQRMKMDALQLYNKYVKIGSKSELSLDVKDREKMATILGLKKNNHKFLSSPLSHMQDDNSVEGDEFYSELTKGTILQKQEQPERSNFIGTTRSYVLYDANGSSPNARSNLILNRTQRRKNWQAGVHRQHKEKSDFSPIECLNHLQHIKKLCEGQLRWESHPRLLRNMINDKEQYYHIIAARLHAGVTIKTRQHHMTPYKKSCTGSDICAWLVANVKEVEGSIPNAVTFASNLLQRNYFTCLTSNVFKNSNQLYRFEEDEAMLNGVPLNIMHSCGKAVSGHPVDVAVKIVTQIIQLYQQQANAVTTTTAAFIKTKGWRDFESATQELEHVNLTQLTTEEEKACFWVNIYHCLMLHAHAKFGFTTSVARGNSFLAATYRINSMEFSLMYIEYYFLNGRIHSNLTTTSIAKLSSKDPRIAFQPKMYPLLPIILNCGAGNSCAPIAVYTSNNFNVQLKRSFNNFLSSKISVGNDVRVPAMLNWHYNLFAPKKSTAIALAIEHCTNSATSKAAVQALIADSQISPTKFNWNFAVNFAKSTGFSSSHKIAPIQFNACIPSIADRAMKWSHLAANGDFPSARYYHSATIVMDAKLYVFGGTNGDEVFGDLYCMCLNYFTWVKLDTTGDKPSNRYGHSVVAYANKLLLFGGSNNTVDFNDLYSYDCEKRCWTQLDPSGPQPSLRKHHCAVGSYTFDTPAIFELYVFGGAAQSADDASDLFKLSLELNEWTVVQTHSELARNFAAAVMFPNREIVIVGGKIKDDKYAKVSCIINLNNAFEVIPIVIKNTPKISNHAMAVHGLTLILSGGVSIKKKKTFLRNSNPLLLHVAEDSCTTPKVKGKQICKLSGHASIVYNDNIIFFGGKDEQGNATCTFSAIQLGTGATNEDEAAFDKCFIFRLRSSLQKTNALPALIPMEDITFGKSIANGASGTIFVGTYKEQEIAIKRFAPITLELMINEISILNMLDHENILEMYGYNDLNASNPCLFLKLYPLGDLHHYVMAQQRPLQMSMVTSIALCVAKALEYMHSLNIVHRDVKALNVLLNSEDPFDDEIAKVMDFGDAYDIDADEEANIAGTIRYCAPECLSNKKWTFASDMYAFGMLLWEVVNRKIPYEDMSFGFQVEKAVLSGLRPDLSDDLQPELCSLIKACWCADSLQRPSASQSVLLLTDLQKLFRGNRRAIINSV